MYRESHERKCPFCNEWMSATAPKCLNCGRRVDEDEEDDDEPAGPRLPPVGPIVAAVGALVAVGLAVAFLAGAFGGRREPPEPRALPGADDRLHRELGRRAGIDSLNASSPTTWAEAEPQLAQGMTFAELTRVLSAKDTPEGRTVFGNAPVEPGGDATSAHVVFLKDVTLTVRLDKDQKVVGWSVRAAH